MQVSKVLVVDGDRTARDALVTGLRFAGMEAHGAESADAAQIWLRTSTANVLVLSAAIAPEVASRVPGDPAQSIIVLTRPTALGRIVERIDSLIEEREPHAEAVLEFGALTFDMESGCLAVGSDRILLGRIESRLLAFFIRLPDKVVSRTQLLQRLWPANTRVAERTVDVYVGRLRVALGRLDCAGYLQTVRCSGYRFSTF